ncbi:MAG TPA: hypothetical protein PKD78_08980 [Saprospiraceae bacterium]|nr:hypothetical protein [Saprospiraceae bacterium]
MKSQCLFPKALPVCLLFLLCSLHAAAQPTDTLQSILERLSAVEGAKITLEADMTTIIANKKTNQYFPGSLITEDGRAYAIELRPRGKFRRKISEIPPLKIKFKKKELKALGLDTLNEIKLVLPTEDKAAGDELIIKEYLAYKMFERLTPASVRARLIRLTIRDTHVEKSKKTMYAILVEDEEETCARLKGSPVSDYGLPADSLLSQQAALMVMFEYMIGNTDWEIAMVRNVRLMRSNETGRILAMPYDFDFSGLVSAPYASPSSESGLKTVRDRFLMSSGLKLEHLKKANQVLRAAKRDLYDVCRSKFLSKVTAAQMIDYLETFFQIIEANDEVPTTLLMPVSTD